MTRTDSDNGLSPLMIALLALFFASGCAALIYEIVWYQLLQLSVGSTAVSLGMLLASFMGGLCIGSLALPRILPYLPEYWQHPLRTFALVEICIAVLGIAELWIIPSLEHIYFAAAPDGFAGSIVRGVIAAVCLLPPTIFMGASLPAIARWFESTPRGAARWALIYGANTAGAVAGCLLAGFYILRLYNIEIATVTAASINVAAAVASIALSFFAMKPRAEDNTGEAPEVSRAVDTGPAWPIYVAVGLSGACALGAEVVWARLMGLMFGATVYSFSIILAVFLIGLAAGTNLGSFIGRNGNPRRALAWSQICAAFGMAWTAYCIAVAMPYWPINPTLSPSPMITFQLDLARSVLALLPPTIAWGASLSLAFAVLAGRKDSGRTVGTIYAANTFGCIVGALASSIVLIPLIGTQKTQQVMVALAGVSAFLVFAPWRNFSIERAYPVITGAAAIALLAISIQQVPGELIAYGRRVAANHGKSTILFTGEGRNTSIATSRWEDGTVQFHVAGKVEASTLPADMKLQRMLGHVAALLHPNPKSVLIVGFGAGVTAGSFTQYPSITRIAICELEPLIPPTTTRFFGAQNYNVMNDKRTQITYDDARHFVAKTKEKFDLITSDPIHPFVKGSASLYSKEYFQMLRDHLNPGGIVTQWIPMYESDEATVKSEIATFMQVFPYATIYANTVDGGGYDLVLVGQNHAPKVDVDAMQARLDRPEYKAVKASLAEVGLYTAKSLLSSYSGDKVGLEPWTRNAQINNDNDMRLQYLAGMSLNQSQEWAIYQKILSYRKIPRNIFTGSEASVNSLLTTMMVPGAEDHSDHGH